MSFFKKWLESAGGAGAQNSQGPPEYIICGLGNPGTSYENTRHNCGFMAVDLLSEQLGFKIKKLKFKSLTALEEVDGFDLCKEDGETGAPLINSAKALKGAYCLIMKPTTYMNLSGTAVVPAMEFYKIPPERTIIVYDDFSLPLGTVKIRRNGSDGGHNGMKNIILESNSDNFPRVKIGIGAPPHAGYAVKDWVLSSFKKDEGKTVESALEKATRAVRLIVSGDIDRAMNEMNGG